MNQKIHEIKKMKFNRIFFINAAFVLFVNFVVKILCLKE